MKYTFEKRSWTFAFDWISSSVSGFNSPWGSLSCLKLRIIFIFEKKTIKK